MKTVYLSSVKKGLLAVNPIRWLLDYAPAMGGEWA
jgi:hypothetical protein